MINRIKKLWSLSRRDPEELDKLLELPDSVIDEGDGKAVFFSEGTPEDYQEFLKEQEGIDKWYKRLRNL